MNREHLEAVALMHWWAITAPRFSVDSRLLAAIPNGGHRHKATAAMLKATGATAGVPDLLIPASRKGWHGLFIEMKRTKGGTVSPEQKDWLAHLNEQGYRAEVCKGFEAAKAVIQDYFA